MKQSVKRSSDTHAPNGPPRRRLVKPKIMLGWKEWAILPDLGDQVVHAKIDTGARTSALHVETMRLINEDGQKWVEFGFVKPPRNKPVDDNYFPFRARSLGKRNVKSSSGHVEERLVIQTRLTVANVTSVVDMTLTSRTRMEFPMLIGRTALRKSYLVAPGKSYLGGKDLQSILKKE